MKHTRLTIGLVFMFGISLTGVQAQTVTTTTGGDATGSGGSTSYTVGQVAYTANTGTGRAVTRCTTAL